MNRAPHEQRRDLFDWFSRIILVAEHRLALRSMLFNMLRFPVGNQARRI